MEFRKKVVRPSRRREMAKKVVADRGVCIRVTCLAFRISESCYRYERKLDAENAEVANWLIKLTDNHRNWGFGLCYLYLRNVKGFKWNHKRVYRIYKELSSIYGSSLANALCARSQKFWRCRKELIRSGRWTLCMTSLQMAEYLDCSM